MTDTAAPAARPLSRNVGAMTLLVLGILGLIVGPILWSVGSNQLNNDQSTADFAHAIGQDNGIDIAATSPAISADQVLIGFGIGTLVLGVVLIVAFIVIAALRPSAPAQ